MSCNVLRYSFIFKEITVKKLVLTITAAAALGVSFSACKKEEPFVIKVGKEKITESALNDKLSVTSADFQKFASTPLGRKHFLDLVVQQSVVIEAAKKAGIEKQAEFKKALEDFKNEQQKQLADYRDGLLMDIYLKEIREKIKASDNDIQNYYNEHKSTFENPIAYTVRHILVSDKETANLCLNLNLIIFVFQCYRNTGRMFQLQNKPSKKKMN